MNALVVVLVIVGVSVSLSAQKNVKVLENHVSALEQSAASRGAVTTPLGKNFSALVNAISQETVVSDGKGGVSIFSNPNNPPLNKYIYKCENGWFTTTSGLGTDPTNPNYTYHPPTAPQLGACFYWGQTAS